MRSSSSSSSSARSIWPLNCRGIEFAPDYAHFVVSRDTLYHLLRMCNEQRDAESGMYVCCLMFRHGFESVTVLADHLIRLFASCGRLDDAKSIFSMVSQPSIYTWNAIISGHQNQHSPAEDVLDLYEDMHKQGKIQPNSVTFLNILKACGTLPTLHNGRQIHDQIIRSVFRSDLIISNALIHMYVQFGSLNEAYKIFNTLPERDVVSWGTIISGYAETGNNAVLSIELLMKMQHEGIKPERVTFLCILKACGSIESVGQGKIAHHEIVKSCFESDVAVGTALIDMYAKCMNLDEAQKVFNDLPNRTIITWGALLAGLVQHGHGHYALELFEKMKLEVNETDKSIFSCVLKACGIVQIKGIGKLIHCDIIHCGVEQDMVVGSMLLDMYVKCGSIEDASAVFNSLPHRDVITWGLMIEGYAQHGESVSALSMFGKMQVQGIKPDKVAFLGVAKACASLGVIQQGHWIHSQVVEFCLESDILLGNTIVDMYGKCGSMGDSTAAFNKISKQDVASWAALIGGFAQSGNLELAEQGLKKMQRQGIKPNMMIFSSILTACSHAGLLKEGWMYFKSIKEDYHVNPSVEHCNCMFDILGRLGYLHAAEHLLKTLPMPPNVVGWVSLLTACKTYGNIKLGARCSRKILSLDPNEASVYMLMADIYASKQMWKDVERIKKARSHVGALKKPGIAWIEVNGEVHEFIVGSNHHQHESEGMIQALRMLNRNMHEEGYVPALYLVLE